MRKTLTFDLDYHDLVLIKKALQIELGKETREKRLADIENMILEIQEVLDHAYTEQYFLKLVVSAAQARILKVVTPVVMTNLHYQLEEQLV